MTAGMDLSTTATCSAAARSEMCRRAGYLQRERERARERESERESERARERERERESERASEREQERETGCVKFLVLVRD